MRSHARRPGRSYITVSGAHQASTRIDVVALR